MTWDWEMEGKHIIETNQQSLLFPYKAMWQTPQLKHPLHSRHTQAEQCVSCPESDSTQWHVWFVADVAVRKVSCLPVKEPFWILISVSPLQGMSHQCPHTNTHTHTSSRKLSHSIIWAIISPLDRKTRKSTEREKWLFNLKIFPLLWNIGAIFSCQVTASLKQSNRRHRRNILLSARINGTKKRPLDPPVALVTVAELNGGGGDECFTGNRAGEIWQNNKSTSAYFLPLYHSTSPSLIVALHTHSSFH